MPSGRRTLTTASGCDRCGATKPRQIERSRVGDIRLDVMRPTLAFLVEQLMASKL